MLSSTGIEVSPSKNCSRYQLHINGDISLAIVQYLWASGNAASLDSAYVDILRGIAQFWRDRLVYNSDTGLYEIHGNASQVREISLLTFAGVVKDTCLKNICSMILVNNLLEQYSDE